MSSGCRETAINMFSRCPNCATQQAVSTRQIRDRRGLCICRACKQPYDALPTLSENRHDDCHDRSEPLSWQSGIHQPQSSGFWCLSSVILVLLLLLQIAYFDGQRLLRHPALHSAMWQVCQSLGCQPLVFSHAEEWALSHGDLVPHLGRSYLLTAALTNQAAVTQAFPQIKLQLTDFKGMPLAERVFLPQDYTALKHLASDQTIFIQLPILFLAQEIGGYSLSLI